MKEKCKRVLAFILFLCALFSSPFSAYAKNFNTTNAKALFWYRAQVNPASITMPTTFSVSGETMQSLGQIIILKNYDYTVSAKDTITASFKLSIPGLQSATASFNIGTYNADTPSLSATSSRTCKCTVDGDTLNITFSSTYQNEMADKQYWLIINPVVSSDVYSQKLIVKVESFVVDCESEQSSFFGKVKEALTNVINWLKEIRDKLVNGFTDVVDSISSFFSSLFAKLGQWFDKVGDWFSTLWDKLSGWFSDLFDKLKAWFEDVGDWFTAIGDRISDFFEKLWNRIWWGNEDGEESYVKPTISNKLLDILETLEEYRQKLKDTVDSMSSAADEVSDYISKGTSFVNGVMGVAGVGFSALVVFGVIFVLVRKVVGR